MIRVAITDDHPVVREGAQSALDREVGIRVISKTSSGQKFLGSIREEMPDVAIVDLAMPEEHGLDLLKQTKREFPDLPVLILSFHPPERYALRCLKDGASGYLDKVSSTDEIAKAIRHIVHKKSNYITPEVAHLLGENIDTETERALHETLSDREFTVFRLIAGGESVTSIASKLSLSPQTIHTYRSRIKDKMHLSSNVEITRYAIKHDLT